ncbi:MAG TPA: aminotransferase class V-fold PLP-dependent enzyme [Panacibacter sp.]|nr:aminotransferase class V-fold PLP-dependent enzyme [Panacibacter sp.]HNP46023.1 aminotransferase class V-fold PLP-dependent enzyme [Panacibacter sp.]
MRKKQPSASWSRRNFVSLMAGVPLALSQPLKVASVNNAAGGFPEKEEFDIRGTYINAAYTHPMSKGSFNEAKNFLASRMLNGQMPKEYDGFDRSKSLSNFAMLINASPEEIAWVPSTMFGENFIVSGLSLPGSNEAVVTDAYHFHGSLHLYGQLAKNGLKLTVVKPRDNRIDLNDLDAAIKPGTKLVALSLVSATTGFQHDLEAVCKLAHAKGAMVYADIIQAAGNVPIDVKRSGVDFCACATYKWLMGDFGIGFLYVRKDRLPQLKRPMIGYRQIANFVSHVLPFDPPGESAFESEASENMSGHFEVGTFANEGIVALRYSLEYLNKVGVANIQQYRQPMIDRMQQQLAGHSAYIPLTPTGSRSAILSYAFKDAYSILKPKLDAADVNIQVYENMIRISPSFYNDMNDIDRLLDVLKTV